MKREMFKTISMVLAVIMLIGIFTACQKSSEGNEQTTTADTQLKTTQMTTEEKAEVVEITVMDKDSPYIPINEKWKMFDLIEQRIGIRVKPQVVPADSYNDKLSITISSGNMPDAVYIPGKALGFNYASMGAFYPISSDWSKTPNFKKITDKYSNYYKFYKSSDGNFYWFNALTDRLLVPFMNAYIIRKDVYDKNGIAIPTTWDEVYNGLVKLKKADPKSYPLIFVDGTKNLINQLSYAWGSGTYLYINESSGKWTCGPMDENFKKMVDWLSKCYSEKLLDPEYIKIESTKFQQKAYGLTEPSAAFFLDNNWAEWGGESQAKNANKSVDLLTIVPPVVSNGVGGRLIPYNPLWEYGYAVSSKAKNLDATLKYFDWMYSEDGMEFTNYGPSELGITELTNGGVLQGGGFNVKSEWIGVKAEETPEYKYGYKRTITNLVGWQDDSSITDYGETYNQTKLMLDRKLPYTFFAKPILTQDEQTKYNNIRAKIEDISNEYVEKFILSALNVDKDWETFMNKLREAGVEDLLKLLDDTSAKMK